MKSRLDSLSLFFACFFLYRTPRCDVRFGLYLNSGMMTHGMGYGDVKTLLSVLALLALHCIIGRNGYMFVNLSSTQLLEVSKKAARQIDR